MCGICGLIRFDDAPFPGEALSAACAALQHRGPDHTGVWIGERIAGAAEPPAVSGSGSSTSGARQLDSSNTPSRGQIGFGATRLAVLDPSASAHQPMHDARGRFHLVYNGELYNHVVLRRELAAAGVEFRTSGDTEVVLQACATWGESALDRLEGMWALAFFDQATGCGFLARDRMGIKPLFFAAGDAALAFASELRALTRLLDREASINQRAVTEHLVFGYISHPDTIHDGVHRLSPGEMLRFSVKGCEPPRAYGSNAAMGPAGSAEEAHHRNYGDVCARVRRTIEQAVARQRVSDVPIGAFLSGGLDSSILVAHLAELSGRPVTTFSVGYAGAARYDERHYARRVADHFGTDHHEVLLSAEDVIRELPRVLDHLGEPVGDSSILPTALISRAARRWVTVALSGDGGDELFGGYWRYLGHAALRAYRRLPGVLRRRLIEPWVARAAVARTTARADRVRQFHKLLRAAEDDPLAAHVRWSRILSLAAEDIFTGRAAVAEAEARAIERGGRLTAAWSADDPLNRVLAFDLMHQLPADMLHKVDLASMMHSLEVRVPLLDDAVIAAAIALPSRYKIDRGLRKRVLVDAYRGRLPDEVLDRPKQGFEVPLGELLRGPLREMFRDVVSASTVASFGFLSHAAIARLEAEHAARRADHADVLFALLSLCWWRRGGR